MHNVSKQDTEMLHLKTMSIIDNIHNLNFDINSECAIIQKGLRLPVTTV